jgi:hypothetical protein
MKEGTSIEWHKTETKLRRFTLIKQNGRVTTHITKTEIKKEQRILKRRFC